MENLADFADRNAEQIMAAASPALRAALEQHLHRSSRTAMFGSFIDPGK
ncbi:hypothetical protein [Nocardia sp. NPDC047038]